MSMQMQWLPVSVRMLVVVVLFSLFWGSVWSDKVCTNSGVPSQYQSHTLRHELLTSKNTPWGKQDLSQLHLINNDDHTLSNSVRRKILSEHQLGWNILDRKKKNSGGLRGTVADILKEVSLHDVRLDPDTIHGLAQQTNLEYLLMLDVDRLVWSFRKNAGLDTPGEPYGGWETPNGELRGHFVGHYLSASAKMWASTHNADLFQKMSSVISALSVCQTKMGTGYLSAFPSELFDRFEALEEVWAPYYTIHKILAGLLDQYSLADNTQALNITLWMTDYFYNRVQNVITKHTIERHWLSLNEETGGMNDVLYKLYTITGDEKHLELAHLFDKPCFLGLLALKADDISGFHANTHIPIVIGSQMRYEITGEPLFKEIGEFFMSIVNSSHSYATGGTSVSEFWSDPKRLADALGTENQESCTTYNMLKVSRHLFRWTKEMSYADYYERALTNGVLGIQRGREPGVMIYMLPMHRGASKARSYHGWGTKFNSFWCCYGTGIESFSKLGDSIYFEGTGKDSALYVIQYISSSLDWRSGQVLISQQVEPAASWNQRLKVKISISAKELEADASTLRLRIPLWTSSNGSSASLNGEDLSLPAPGNFLSLTKSWSTGDIVSLDLPLTLRTEAIKDDRPEFTSVQAFLYGPYLLAGLSKGDWDIKMNPDTFLSDSITPIPEDYNSNLITLTQGSSNSVFALTNSNQLITMATYPEPGTDSALAATFRLIAKNPTLETSRAANDGIDQLVMLEPIDFPGMFLSHQGEDKNLRVSGGSSEESIFHLIRGLDGEDGTVSLESESSRGCFIYSDWVNNAGGANVTLNCSSAATPADTLFQKAASFALQDGVSVYHDISFVATGLRRNFLLVPLFSLRDESYTVYFNVTA